MKSNEVTHLVIPDQVGSSDTCEVTAMGQVQIAGVVDSQDICVLGWIHVRT